MIDTDADRLLGIRITNPSGSLTAYGNDFFTQAATKTYRLLNDSHQTLSSGKYVYNLYNYSGGFVNSAFTLTIPKCFEVELKNLKTNISKRYIQGTYNIKSDFQEVHWAAANSLKNCTPVRFSGLVVSEYDDLPTFSADYYLATNGDVARAFGRQNFRAARAHWDDSGKKEGRGSSPSFQVKEYLQLNPDLISAYGNNYAAAIDHFKIHGIKEGRQASYSFNVRNYLAHYSDLRNAFGSNGFSAAHLHWSYNGLNEGRRSTSTFDVSVYLNKYPDLSIAFGKGNYLDALVHYHQFGRSEGRTSN